MKILMTSETFIPRIGGAEIHVDNLIKALVERGHQIVLITNELSEIDYKVEGLRVIRISWNFSNAVKIFRILWKEAKTSDVIHSHYCHRLAMIAGTVARLRRLRHIITLHGMGILDPATKKWRARKLHAFYRRTSLWLCSHIISTSQDLADVAYKFVLPSKVTVIYNGYDPSLFNPEHYSGEPEPNTLLTVRRLVPKNGIQYVIEAMPEILAHVPVTQLNIVGDGVLREYLEKRVVELGISSHVHFLGFKQGNELVNQIARSEIVIFPSTAESVSLACVEAMGMKKKIIASRVGGLVELLGEADERGWLVDLVDWQGSNYDAPLKLPSKNISRLASKVVEVLNLNAGNDSHQTRAYDFVCNHLSWKSIVSQTVNLYE